MNKDHHDFRPILAEIEERPPNPIGKWFLWTAMALLIIVLLGLYFVKVDVVVSARGKIIPMGDVKVLQPLETGVVTAINVKEGDFVKAGDILLEIDPSVDTGDLEGKSRNLDFSKLTMERINAVLSGNAFKPADKEYQDGTAQVQAAHYLAQREAYDSSLKEKEKSLVEAETERATLLNEIGHLSGILTMTREDERRAHALFEAGALAENRYREKVRERMNIERELEVKNGQAMQAAARIGRIKDEMVSFKSGFQDRLLSEYSASLQSKNVLEAEVNSLRFRKEKRLITSPVNGYIYLLPSKTLGGVVTTAQPVAGIVPEKTPLIANVIISNKDIGFVRDNQDCVVKVDTFDFQKYGTIKGQIMTISPFSVDEQDKNQQPSQSEEMAQQQGGYPLHITLLSEELRAKNGTIHHIRPGMTVTAEINVGKRRVLEFFLFPVIKYLDEGLKVR
ncbi:MAG: HlyD family type I secretion periplasmic adaptor subunit [Syntrophobacterales bacterium]|nr:HlyD family type I secretion periplasmic adaptor subunit [Syntrophobacterales bacterium]